ncbi:Stp1/IreP family PP2C-type Ser/Thr phosphatase [bacterium]|nr:Stp1/IreP family PP2C-type Ser/Thr phosphatase [bacterium]
MKFRAYGLSDLGRVRKLNEDSFLVSDDLKLYLVADGMGGHAAGDVASRKSIELIKAFIERTAKDNDITWPFEMNPELAPEANKLIAAVQIANKKIYEMSFSNPELKGMGTTIAGLFIAEAKVYIVHVGDSRVYLMRNGRLKQITEDHSWVNEQVKENVITEDEAKQHRWKNVITRALGSEKEVKVDLQEKDIVSGDIFLICSDGLSGMVERKTMEDIIKKHINNLSEAAEEMIDYANKAGGVDNITVILIGAQGSN